MARGKYERPREPREHNNTIKIILLCVFALAIIVGLIMVINSVSNAEGDAPVVENSATTEPLEKVTTPTPELPELTEPPEPSEPYVVGTASLGATGDILMHKGVINSGKIGTNEYNYDEIFKYVTEYYQQYDIMVANMEGTLSGGDSDDDYVGYPQFNAPDAIATSLSTSGVDIMLTANNHTYDNGTHGLTRTQDVITENNMDYLGTQKSMGDDDFLIKEVNGINIGMIAYTYESNRLNGKKALNGLPVDTQDTQKISSFDYEDLETFYNDITLNINCMKNNGAEAIVLFIHWGDEYNIVYNEKQEEIAQKLNALGVDVIIGGHPHVIQPFRVLTSESGHKTYCIYSLGNAVSNQNRNSMSNTQNSKHTENGLIVGVTFEEWSDGSIVVKEFTLLPTYVHKTTVDGKNAYYIIPLDINLSSWEQFGVSEDRLNEAYSNAMLAIGAVG